MVEFSSSIAEQVCALIADGNSLRKIEKMDGMPTKSAVMYWLLQGEALKASGDTTSEKVAFLDQYTRAREIQADSFADEIIEISDESTYDSFVDADGRTVVNHEHIARDRLRVDSRKWLAGKMRPKKYGDKIVQEQTGKDGGPISMTIGWEE